MVIIVNRLSVFESFNSWLSEVLPLKIYNSLPKILISLASAVLIVIIGFWLGNLAEKLLLKILEKRNVDYSVHHFLSKSLSVFIKIIFVIMAISQLGFNINSFVAALGAAGVTMGLGLKDSISQLASGIQILFNKPFHSGDFIEIDGLSGRVESIQFMDTTLITSDNKKITIPNSRMTSSNIINYTSQETRRIDMVFAIKHSENIQKAKDVINTAALKNPNVKKEPAPYIAVKEYTNNGVNLVCQIWCENNNYWNTFYSMQEDVKNALDENGVETPFK